VYILWILASFINSCVHHALNDGFISCSLTLCQAWVELLDLLSSEQNKQKALPMRKSPSSEHFPVLWYSRRWALGQFLCSPLIHQARAAGTFLIARSASDKVKTCIVWCPLFNPAPWILSPCSSQPWLLFMCRWVDHCMRCEDKRGTTWMLPSSRKLPVMPPQKHEHATTSPPDKKLNGEECLFAGPPKN
jgi:hypothetical protein